MAITAMATARNNVLVLSTLALAISSAAIAGEFTLVPKFSLEETYSDNVELTRHNETSSLVSQAGILFDADYNSQNLAINWRSTSKYALFSHNHDQDNDYHTLQSNLAFTLWPNGITLTASADISNQSRDSARNALADIVSGDTVQIERYTSGLAYNASNSDFVINSAANYLLTEAEDGFGEQEGWQLSLTTENGASARLVFWDATGSFQSTKNNRNESEFYQVEVKVGLITPYKLIPFLRYYDEDIMGNIGGGRAVESNSYGAGMRWLITPRLRFDISYNEPINSAVDLDGNERDAYWDGQLKWQPTTRTQFAIGASERFYGNSYNAELTHRNRRLTNSIEYSEQVQAFTRNNFVQVALGSFWCPDDFGNNLNSCFAADNQDIDINSHQLITISDVEIGEDDIYSLNKNLQWTSELALPRTTFTLQVYRNNRLNLETRIEDESAAASFKASRKLSSRSTFGINMSFSENHFQIGQDSERIDRYRKYEMTYEKSMNSNLSADITLGLINRSSDNLVLNYEEARVGLQVTKEF